MNALLCNPGSPVVSRGRIFRSSGKLYRIGDAPITNPFFEGGRLSARIIVGFNVGDTPTYNLEDLMRIALLAMQDLGQPQGATFLAQRGRFAGAPGQEPVTEEGGQILILDFSGRTKDKFSRDIAELADVIRQKMRQWSVLVEIQSNGIPILSGEVRDAQEGEVVVDIDELMKGRR